MSQEIIFFDNLKRNDRLTNSTIIQSFGLATAETEEFEKKFKILAKSCLKQNSKILVLPILEKCHKNVKKQVKIERELTVLVPSKHAAFFCYFWPISKAFKLFETFF